MKYLKTFNESKVKKVYFAHPKSTYGTELEDRCIDLLEKELGAIVLNPSDDHVQNYFKQYKEENDNYMQFFSDLISDCDYLAYLPFEDGKIGAGIVYEAGEAYNDGKEIYEIGYDMSLKLVDFDHVLENSLSVEQTRNKRLG